MQRQQEHMTTDQILAAQERDMAMINARNRARAERMRAHPLIGRFLPISKIAIEHAFRMEMSSAVYNQQINSYVAGAPTYPGFVQPIPMEYHRFVPEMPSGNQVVKVAEDGVKHWVSPNDPSDWLPSASNYGKITGTQDPALETHTVNDGWTVQDGRGNPVA